MSLITFKSRSIKYGNSGYFTGNAQLMRMAAIGEKAGLGLVQKLEPKDHVPAPKLAGRIRATPGIRIDTQSSTQADFEASVAGSIKVVGFSGSLGQTWQSLKAGELQFVQFWMEQQDVIDAVNASPKSQDQLHGYGMDGRIVWSTLVMTTAQISQSFTTGPKAALSIDVAGVVTLDLGGGASVSGGSSISFGPDTVAAYGLLKLEWDGKKNRFTDAHVDEPGLG